MSTTEKTSSAQAIDMNLIDSLIDPYIEEPNALIALMQDIQNEFSYLPEEALHRMSERLNVPFAHVYGLATFYKAFSLAPKGKHRVCVCTGTTCHVKGAQRILDRLIRELGIEEGQTTVDGDFSIEEMKCIGACSVAPIISVGERKYGRITQVKLIEIVDKYRKGGGNGGDQK